MVRPSHIPVIVWSAFEQLFSRYDPTTPPFAIRSQAKRNLKGAMALAAQERQHLSALADDSRLLMTWRRLAREDPEPIRELLATFVRLAATWDGDLAKKAAHARRLSADVAATAHKLAAQLRGLDEVSRRHGLIVAPELLDPLLLLIEGGMATNPEDTADLPEPPDLPDALSTLARVAEESPPQFPPSDLDAWAFRRQHTGQGGPNKTAILEYFGAWMRRQARRGHAPPLPKLTLADTAAILSTLFQAEISADSVRAANRKTRPRGTP